MSRFASEARRWFPLLNTQYFQNLGENLERSVLTLNSLSLPCCVRNTAWPLKKCLENWRCWHWLFFSFYVIWTCEDFEFPYRTTTAMGISAWRQRLTLCMSFVTIAEALLHTGCWVSQYRTIFIFEILFSIFRIS